MKIYEFDGFPNPARIRMALAEKGLTDQAQFISVNVPEGEHRKPEFLAKNPSGAVPVLELDDGQTIAECTAITEYIDHIDGDPKLTGATPAARGRIHMMQRRAEQKLLDAVADYFHHATPGLGPDIETYQNAEWGERRKMQAYDGMRYFDDVLAEQDYVAGDDYSMADITALAGLAFADFVGMAIPPECANLTEWRARASARYA